MTFADGSARYVALPATRIWNYIAPDWNIRARVMDPCVIRVPLHYRNYNG